MISHRVFHIVGYTWDHMKKKIKAMHNWAVALLLQRLVNPTRLPCVMVLGITNKFLFSVFNTYSQFLVFF